MNYLNIPCGKKEGFNGQDMECIFCPENIICIPYSHATVKCSLKTGMKCFAGSSSRNLCENDHCDRLLELMAHEQKFSCENFGTPKKELIKKCLTCPEEIFKQCEIMEALLQDQRNFTLEDAEESIENLELELSIENESCFGEYTNKPICFSECEFVYRCMRKTGITSDANCKFFPIKREDLFTSEQCNGCICIDECNSLLINEEKIQENQNQKEKKSFFHNIRNLRNIYDEFINEEK